MPPLRKVDRGIDGELLKTMEESGHGQRMAIIDPSYRFPDEAVVVDYHGDSSVTALVGILTYLPIEGPVIIMAPDGPNEPDKPPKDRALKEFRSAIRKLNVDEPDLNIEILTQRRLDGFYDEANDPEEETYFIRTRDPRAFACAMFVVGHSQE